MWFWGLAAVTILSAGCGRVGYDATAIDDADPNPIDGTPGDVSTGLVARYSFDVDLESDSLGLHDATCVPSCPARNTNGYLGAALDMSGGAEHLVVADTAGAFDHSSGFTVSGWVRYRDYSKRTCLMTKPVGAGGDNSWALCTDTGGTPFLYSCVACDFVSASQTIALDTWVHFAATFDGTKKTLYVDGAMAGQVDGEVSFDSSDIVIGGDNDSSFAFATDGLVDELRVYNRSLSATEIGIISGP